MKTSQTPEARARIGLALALAVLAAWAGLLAASLAGAWSLVLWPLAVLLQTWLYTGLFIVAHDCMHGSLAPGHPGLNRGVGRVALALYAGFSFDRLLPCHHAHHRHAGTQDDPDFDARHPDRFWPWYLTFLRRYFGWRQMAVMAAASVAGVAAGIPLPRLLALWALPAILSSLQLFRWGTWLPHRHEAESGFTDRHRARSSPHGTVRTLLSCFHFGLHHEHHLHPGEPWWRLPAVARTRRQA